MEDGNNKEFSQSNQYSLEQQRQTRINQEKEQKRLQQQELLAAEKKKQQQENEQIRRKELVSNIISV